MLGVSASGADGEARQGHAGMADPRRLRPGLRGTGGRGCSGCCSARSPACLPAPPGTPRGCEGGPGSMSGSARCSWRSALPRPQPRACDQPKNFTAKSAEIAKNCQLSPSRRSLRTDRAHLRGLPGECWAVRFSSQEVWARRLWASEAPPRRPGRILRESKKCRNFFCLSAKKVTHPDANIQAE